MSKRHQIYRRQSLEQDIFEWTIVKTTVQELITNTDLVSVIMSYYSIYITDQKIHQLIRYQQEQLTLSTNFNTHIVSSIVQYTGSLPTMSVEDDEKYRHLLGYPTSMTLVEDWCARTWNGRYGLVYREYLEHISDFDSYSTQVGYNMMYSNVATYRVCEHCMLVQPPHEFILRNELVLPMCCGCYETTDVPPVHRTKKRTGTT